MVQSNTSCVPLLEQIYFLSGFYLTCSKENFFGVVVMDWRGFVKAFRLVGASAHLPVENDDCKLYIIILEKINHG